MKERYGTDEPLCTLENFVISYFHLDVALVQLEYILELEESKMRTGDFGRKNKPLKFDASGVDNLSSL